MASREQHRACFSWPASGKTLIVMVAVMLMTLVSVMILVMVMTANPRDALVAMGEEAGKTCKQVQRVLFTDEQVGDDGKAHRSSQWALKNFFADN